MTLLGARHLMLRHVTALAPLIALVAPIDRAEAACDPASPVNNGTVTCTGTTIDQNGPDGYGSSTDKGNTYNFLSGASVAGNELWLAFQ